jgi:DNA primase
MNLSDVEAGCYIDGSHMSSFNFTTLVIEMAHEYGFEMDFDQFVKDVNGIRDDLFTDDDIYDIMDALDWTYQDALDYLNDNTREGLYWEVIDQSLYLVEDADASQ